MALCQLRQWTGPVIWLVCSNIIRVSGFTTTDIESQITAIVLYSSLCEVVVEFDLLLSNQDMVMSCWAKGCDTSDLLSSLDFERMARLILVAIFVFQKYCHVIQSSCLHLM